MKTPKKPWPVIRPVRWPEILATMGSKFSDGEHWACVAHVSAEPMLSEMHKRFYPGEREKDLMLIMIAERGELFILAAGKKDHMTRSEYADLLRRHSATDEATMLSSEIQLIVPANLVAEAWSLASKLFSRDSEDLAMSD